MSRIIHQLAHCLDCNKQWDDYIGGKAQKQAYAHAKATGHRVQGETGTGWSYHFPKQKSLNEIKLKP